MSVNSTSPQEETDQDLLNGVHYTGDKGPWFGARHSIIITMAIGSSFVICINTIFSLILVSMTTQNVSSNANIPTYEFNNKGVILSSSMWLGIPIQLIAGQLGKQYGHKWLILGSAAANAVFFMLIPAFASIWGSTGVIFCRVMEGGANGILGPVAAGVGGLWVPAEERATAAMIGTGVTFFMVVIASVAAGPISASSLGYPGCIYIIGALNLVWCLAWFFLGYQNPATHPRITPAERKYIETSLNSRKTQHIPTPWLKLLTSLHFWAPVVAAVGANWIDTIMATVNLVYVTKAWGVDIGKGTSTLAIAPILGVCVGVFLAPLSDCIIKRRYVRLVNARRIFHTVGIVGASLALLCMTYVPAGKMVLIVMNLCAGNIFTIMFNLGGAGLNILDIAPTFAGIITGFASTFSQCFALFAPITIDWMVKDESDRAEWRKIFLLTGAITLGTAIFFDIFATDKRRWDNPDEENSNNKSKNDKSANVIAALNNSA